MDLTPKKVLLYRFVYRIFHIYVYKLISPFFLFSQISKVNKTKASVEHHLYSQSHNELEESIFLNSVTLNFVLNNKNAYKVGTHFEYRLADSYGNVGIDYQIIEIKEI